MCGHSAVSRPAAATSLKRGRNGELSLAPSRPGRLGRMITKSTDTQDMTRRRIALIAHDHKKQDLREWARYNRSLLTAHHLFATGTTGRLLGDELGLSVTCFQSGPLGGDQQIGGRIADGEIDLLIFFWDPLEPQPHDPDVKALLRVAVVWNIPVACNRATADFVISSPLISQRYQRQPPDYRTHADRRFPPGAGGSPRRAA
jgi:methylglyoxal synthase